MRPARGGGAVVSAVITALMAGCTNSAAVPPPSPRPSAPGSVQALQAAFIAVVDAVRPSVVQIETGVGLGSGVVFDSKGDIVTNYHVVEGARSFTITLATGKQYQGKLVGTFQPDDLAVVHIDAPDLHPAAFADSAQLEVGEIVLAIGNPLGLSSSVTEGIVSATGRTLSEGDGGATLPDLVQTSAAINPGNSGGALVDLDSEVVGIPTLGADLEVGGAAPGIGFAISSNMAKNIAGQIIKSGHVTSSGRAYLGVGVANSTSGGVPVTRVDPSSPAAAAGIKAGDLIQAIGGRQTPSTTVLTEVLAELKPGERVAVDLAHLDGSKSTVQLTLGQYPGS